VTVRRGADADTIRDDVRELVLALTDALDPQATLYRSQVVAKAFAASSDIINVQVTTPSADLAPATAAGTLRVPADRLTVNVTEV
jgi:hypothetical protein